MPVRPGSVGRLPSGSIRIVFIEFLSFSVPTSYCFERSNADRFWHTFTALNAKWALVGIIVRHNLYTFKRLESVVRYFSVYAAIRRAHIHMFIRMSRHTHIHTYNHTHTHTHTFTHAVQWRSQQINETSERAMRQRVLAHRQMIQCGVIGMCHVFQFEIEDSLRSFGNGKHDLWWRS